MDIEYDQELETRCEYEQESFRNQMRQSDDDNEYIDNLERARDMNCERGNIWK